MATTQQVRAQVKQGQWSSIFPNEQVTETQSALFVKKLLAVAVSSISYLRALFPETAFGDRFLEDVKLKILRDDADCPEACTVIQWIRGCFDALEKKYLKAVLIGIYEDPEDPDTVIEQYSFKFAYGDGMGFDIYKNGERITSAKSDKEIKKETTRLLRTLLILSQTLNPLPDDVMMSMKLLYYEDVTPEDYNPPGFKDGDCETFYFKEEPLNIKVGDVATQFHSIKMRVKTQNHDLQEEIHRQGDDVVVPDEEVVTNMHDDTVSLYQQAGSSKNNPVRSDKDEGEEDTREIDYACDLDETCNEADDESQIGNKDSQPNETLRENTRLSTPASSVVADESLNEDVTTKCNCGVNEDDGLMILCAVCNSWQHATCYGILNPDDAPESHYCVECSWKSEHKCTDEQLAQIADLTIIQSNCLWRRALLAVLETSRVLAPSLSKRLGIPLSVATCLLKRLENEGFVKPGGKAKRFGKFVQKEQISGRGINKYFKYIDQEDVNMVTEQASNMQISKSETLIEESSPSRKGSKRKSGGTVYSAKNTDLCFELADSQQSESPSQEKTLRKRRKRSSVSANPMCV